jgi:hypothetical protein
VILPTTMQSTLAAPLSQVIGVGVLANVVIVALIMAAWEVYQRVRR